MSLRSRETVGSVLTAAMSGQVTRWLRQWKSGDAAALEHLMPFVYDELREVAKRQLRHESSAHTLTPTALVHEVYLRFVQQRQLVATDREHFFAIAGRTMRRILVDHARAQRRQKRGGGERPVELDENAPLLEANEVDEVLALEEALERLAGESERAVRVVECRIFAGLTLEETASALSLSSKSVQRTWSAVSAWLRKEIGELPGKS